MDPSYPVTGADCWSGGARVKRRHLRSGRAPAPARRSGRVSSRRDPSNDQVNFCGSSLIPPPRRGAEAYIVSVVGHPYLATLLPLWLTMLSYPSTTPAVLAVRNASAGKGCQPYLCQVDRTTDGVSVLPVSGRPYDRWRPPYLHPTSFPRRVDHVGRADSTEQELGNLNGAGADPIEVNSSTNPGDLAERVNSGTNPRDLAEKVNSSTNPGIWPRRWTRSQILGFGREGELGHKSWDLAEKVNSGTNPRVWPRRWTRAQILRILVERVNSGTNLGDLTERVNSDTNPGDLTEKVNSGMNPRMKTSH
ncbi:hypothetical protein BHM03_00062632 [Ensete ventricosum]|nr:hypothetical protein BHM03_00062632 [Ensete ventricosum]